jgi:hypothetical protein
MPAVSLFGRLRADVSTRQAAAETTVIAAGNPHRLKDADFVSIVEPFARSNADPDERRTAIAAAAGVALLVLVFAANVANLMLARTAARRRELAVRAALGASRGRLIGQVALEPQGSRSARRSPAHSLPRGRSAGPPAGSAIRRTGSISISIRRFCSSCSSSPAPPRSSRA